MNKTNALEAVNYSRNFATAKPDIGAMEREHILGLCSMLERLAQPDSGEAGDGGAMAEAAENFHKGWEAAMADKHPAKAGGDVGEWTRTEDALPPDFESVWAWIAPYPEADRTGKELFRANGEWCLSGGGTLDKRVHVIAWHKLPPAYQALAPSAVVPVELAQLVADLPTDSNGSVYVNKQSPAPASGDGLERALYDSLAAADNQDLPLEEYPARILKVLADFGAVPAGVYDSTDPVMTALSGLNADGYATDSQRLTARLAHAEIAKLRATLATRDGVWVPDRLWIDCEFNEFKGELISMALVDAQGREWYEVVECQKPGSWVAQHVIPILGKPPVSYQEMQASLHRFLAQYRAVHLVADWPEDVKHFCEALITGPGYRIDTPPLTLEVVRVDAPSELPHNALADARGIRDFMLAAAPKGEVSP